MLNLKLYANKVILTKFNNINLQALIFKFCNK